jgi:predicted HNH restriction endonuclease
MLAIELDDFRSYPLPVSLTSVGLTDKGWSDKKTVEDDIVVLLLRNLNIEPSEVSPDEHFTEGTVRQVLVNTYERNVEARRRCLELFGAVCAVCDFNFGSVYGPVAEGFIHIHHKRALSDIGQEYRVDPANDLCPVCPNCHAVIHLGGKLRTIEEVRQLIKQQKGS